MDASQIQDLDGKISENNILRDALLFFSPVKFWAVYGYWFCLVYYTLHSVVEDLGPSAPFPEWLCPFRWGCSDSVGLFFFTIPIFLFLVIAQLGWSAHTRKFKLFVYGVLHTILIILLTGTTNEITNGIVWSYSH